MDKDKTAIALKNKENQEEFLPSYNDLDIQGMIYEIRGQQVMLDFDLAKLCMEGFYPIDFGIAAVAIVPP